MEVVKRKLVPIKSMVSVKSSTLSSNFMVIIGMHTLIFFLMRMLNTLLESMMTKIIPLLPLKKLETMIVNVYSIYRTGTTMLKSSGTVIGIHLLKVILKSKPTFHNFTPLLTLKRLSPKTKLFNIFKMDIYLDSSNVTFTHLNTLKNTFRNDPYFKNTEVSLKDVGQHMQEYAKQHNIKDVPRHLLIGSYFGKKIGLVTPLLKWYLEHGLVITCIYTTIEYVPNAALKDFTVHGLHGDCDPWYALTAEMRKLEGNASYGALITNKEKHHGIIYVDESEIGRQIISPHFYNMTELPDVTMKLKEPNL